MGKSDDSSHFRKRFLLIYFLAQFCEYLQGPYLYALHSVHYRLPRDKVGLLFFISSLSSSLFGCVGGPLSDTHEKAWGCVAFCFISIASCVLTSSCLSFYWLMLARALGGVASSLLETAFESYAVCEHHSRGFSHASLDTLLAYASGGTGLVAVFSGLAAAASVKVLHDLRAPFTLGALVGAVCLLFILLLWRGGPAAGMPHEQTTRTHGTVVDCLLNGRQAAEEAVQLFVTRQEARVCGLLQVGFEVPLDLFILLWADAVPLGLSQGVAFAALMVGLSAGSYLFILLTRDLDVDLYRVISAAFFFGSLALLGSIATTCNLRRFAAHMAFEVVIGILYPALSSLRAVVLPDSCRASATNVPRVVFNLLLLGVLGSNALQHPARVFAVSSVGMAVAGGCAARFTNIAYSKPKSDAT
ncbi:hypothetical protein ACSSS7_004060 [Eimeria intestinalis]